MKLCECGCGQPAPIAVQTRTQLGIEKGKPRRFVNGHHMRGKKLSVEHRAKIGAAQTGERNSRWAGDDVLYHSLHHWLHRHKQRKGKCEVCGKKGPTEFANISGHYLRDVDDFAEMCVPCHKEFDNEFR